VRHRFALAAAWVASTVYVGMLLDHKWIPHDDGCLAQAAERVLLGEMPHRDFTDVYTGGLSYLNAVGLEVFGVRLMALRYVLFLFFIAWVPVVYYCAARFLRPFGAAAITLLAVAWSVPNYPAAMPSWYNLFFATFGAAALLRFSADPRRRWLVLAGAMGGCSLLAKIAGLYFIAACLLFLVVHEAGTRPPGREVTGRWVYPLTVLSALLGFLAGIVVLLRGHLTVEHAYHFLVPAIALAGLTWVRVVTVEAAPASSCIRRLWALGWPFLAGVSVPVAVFLAPYAVGGSIMALLSGVFVSPTGRLAVATFSPMSGVGVVFALPLIAGFIASAGIQARGPRRFAAGVWAFMLVGGLIVGGMQYAYTISWASASQSIPLVVCAGAGLLVWRARSVTDRLSWDRCFTLLAIAGLCSLVAFPFAAPIYFCYAAPLALLALVAVLRVAGGPPQPFSAVATAYFLAFAVVALNPQGIEQLGFNPERGEPLARLHLLRGGVLAKQSDVQVYEAAVSRLTDHARGGYTLAGPDAPEIYFLSGLRNPTRRIFDFLEAGGVDSRQLLEEVDRHGISAVAINREVRYSQPIDATLDSALAARLPRLVAVGKFAIRWRE
jgi:hypothetical protein